MRLRPRQKTFVERSVAALASRGNTLGAIYDAVTPKTLGAIADRWATLGVIADADLGGGS